MGYYEIRITPVLKEINPKMVLGILQCEVANSDFNPELWKEIQQMERTAIRLETNQLLMVFYAFNGPEDLLECINYAAEFLKQYAAARAIYSEVMNFYS